MESCLFCKIIAGEVPSAKIYDDTSVVSFLDINPVNIGHTLVVPKKHFATLHDIPDETLTPLMQTVRRLADAIKAAVNADGINIEMNNGEAAGQIIHHAHIHIVPRYKGDGFTHWKGARGYADGEIQEVLGKIKSEIL